MPLEYACGEHDHRVQVRTTGAHGARGRLLGFLVTFNPSERAPSAVMLLYLYPIRLTASSLVGTDIVHRYR